METNMEKNEIIEIYSRLFGDVIKKIEGYMIFADESMNMRKVRIKDSIKNEIRNKYFVLGGIGIPVLTNLGNLKEEFINDNFPQGELKYKYFSYGSSDFKKVLKSKRLNILFKYFLNNRIYIHATVMNYWYWAICDIVDSIMEKESFEIDENNELKMGMYEGLMKEYDLTYKLFDDYDFPSIPIGKEKVFLQGINGILKKVMFDGLSSTDIEYETIKKLISIIDNKISTINRLIFIQDETPKEIVNSLVNVYIQKAYLFSKNGIIFDIETNIKQDMNSISSNLINELNCKFVDSKNNLAIQLSDVVCGFIARFFEFVTDYNESVMFLNNLEIGSIEFQNIILFKRLFELSIKKYQFNYSRIISRKQDYYLSSFLLLAENLYYENRII